MSGLTIYLPGILAIYAAVLLSIASPGPNVLAVIGTAMAQAGRLAWHWRSASALALSAGRCSPFWACRLWSHAMPNCSSR